MREIKFRAMALGRDGTMQMMYSRDEPNLSQYFSWTDDFEQQQYTGLKDKNGVEIYEGDILGKHPYGYLKADGTKDGRYKGKEWDCFAVEWGEYDASEANLVGGYEYETDGKYAGWNIIVGGYNSDLENYEVIGNIYENPELLQEAK